MKRTVEYFEEHGSKNTSECIKLVQDLVKEGFQHVVVASTSGQTGALFAEAMKGAGVNLIVVTHSAGFKAPSEVELKEDFLMRIISAGARVYTGTILTHSLETALASQFQGLYPTMLIAQAWRTFGQGMKVACEITMEACDAGLLPEGKEVVAVGGTGRGADAVAVIRSAASKRFLDLKVLEVIAKPRG